MEPVLNAAQLLQESPPGPGRLPSFVHIHHHLELHLFSRLCWDMHHHGNARGEITQVLASSFSLELGKMESRLTVSRKGKMSLKQPEHSQFHLGTFPLNKS